MINKKTLSTFLLLVPRVDLYAILEDLSLIIRQKCSSVMEEMISTKIKLCLRKALEIFRIFFREQDISQ